MDKVEVIIILITVPDVKSAEKIAAMLVEKSLAACVNIITGVKSVYRWEGELNHDDELLLLVKTVRDNFDAISLAVKSIHPYDLPEIIAVPVVNGFNPYIEWIKDETSVDSGKSTA